jgi:hypothetical protein
MSPPLAFDRLVHSDWSVVSSKRWTAVAQRSRPGWRVESLRRTPASDQFLDHLFDPASRTLAGFDFPIGLPTFYLDKMGWEFRELLSTSDSDRARRFFDAVDTLFDVSPDQPFYLRHPKGGRRADLLRGLGCDDFNHLLRRCDKATKTRSRAESIFWTVGAKQVGKAALSGWREILIPALGRGACLWPFEGPLSSLDSNVLTIAETYPAEAYQHVGMRRTIKKRSQQGRSAGCRIMLEWGSRHGIAFSSEIEAHMQHGFGERGDGEDPFDALAGLCGMIEVADGRRAEAVDFAACAARREGWILGQIEVTST